MCTTFESIWTNFNEYEAFDSQFTIIAQFCTFTMMIKANWLGFAVKKVQLANDEVSLFTKIRYCENF